MKPTPGHEPKSQLTANKENPVEFVWIVNGFGGENGRVQSSPIPTILTDFSGNQLYFTVCAQNPADLRKTGGFWADLTKISKRKTFYRVL